MRNQLVEIVREFPYLDSIISEDDEVECYVKTKIAKAALAFGCLKKSIFINLNLSVAVKQAVYKAVVLTTLYVIQATTKRILINNLIFLALVDIKAFGCICTHLQCCFYLASHFYYIQGVLFSIISYMHENSTNTCQNTKYYGSKPKCINIQVDVYE